MPLALRCSNAVRRVCHGVSGQCLALLAASLAAPATSQAQTRQQTTIAGHAAQCGAAGHPLPWIAWITVLEREILFYQHCPSDHGYARFVTETFLEGDCAPMPDRLDTIPAPQNGMGIISYWKLYALHDGRDARYRDTARALGDYLVQETGATRVNTINEFSLCVLPRTRRRHTEGF
jgi:hypothetical protein